MQEDDRQFVVVVVKWWAVEGVPEGDIVYVGRPSKPGIWREVGSWWKGLIDRYMRP